MNNFNLHGQLLQGIKTKENSQRFISTIAMEIAQDWKQVNYAAKPYLSAMYQLQKVTDYYIHDSADMIIRYFLSNAKTWKGEKARAIKKELKQLIGEK